MEPDRFVPVKPEVQAGPGQQNHEPSTQRSCSEELRREPITDKYVVGTAVPPPPACKREESQ